jgi:isopenicillin N synthase-like dioxygenase
MIIGEVISSDVETYGASAHSDYGMVTLLLTDGVPGLQVNISEFLVIIFY